MHGILPLTAIHYTFLYDAADDDNKYNNLFKRGV